MVVVEVFLPQVMTVLSLLVWVVVALLPAWGISTLSRTNLHSLGMGAPRAMIPCLGTWASLAPQVL